MSYLDWHVGMKVVCIKRDRWDKLWPNETGPVFGGVYTIRTIEARPGGICVRFDEVVNPVNAYRGGPCEARFLATRFRPVAKRATDISIFTALLTPSEDDIIEIELLDYEIMAVPFQ